MTDAQRERQAARRRDIRARSTVLRRELRDRRRARTAPARRRRRIAALLLAILVLLLVCLCTCGPTPPPPAPEPSPEALRPVELTEVIAEPAPPRPRPPLTGRLDRTDRPDYPAAAPTPLPWIDAFRIQVSARSARLAQCFIGREAPGRLKWTTSVNPVEGRISDNTIEPVLTSEELSRDERTCVLAVLADPPYDLSAPDRPSVPSRVSLVIEF